MNNSSLNNKTMPELSCWVITEGMIGTENQCLGIAEALELSPRVIKIGLRQPWKSLSPWLRFENQWCFMPQLTAPWPDLVIASGRKSIAAARYIKKQSKGKSFIVQVQNPKTALNQFDLVTAPYHDGLHRHNVVTTHGAPNRLTQDKLTSAKEQFAPLFKNLTAPRVAVLIGGNSRTHTITQDITKNLIKQLNNLDASLMVTCSRRTGEDNQKLLNDGLNMQNSYFWDGTGDNPYLGMLAWADYILVTEDSVSMLSDAATAGKPVYIISLEGQSKRFDKCHQHFRDIGVSRPFNGNLEEWAYEPISDAKTVAQAIKKKLG